MPTATIEQLLLIFITLIVIYFFGYQKNKLLGNVGLLVLGLGILYQENTTIGGLTGWLIFSIGIVSMLHDFYTQYWEGNRKG